MYKYRVKSEDERTAVASLEVREYLAKFIKARKSQHRAFSLTHINGHFDDVTDIPSQQKQPQSSSSLHQHCETPTGDLNLQPDSSLLSNDSSNPQNSNSDHPLRKTASLPTMHTTYKAQSLSRRRQIERRTTMSPLQNRQRAKSRRPLLHSTGSSSTEYSSNPCIIDGSQPQTRSPTPPSHSNFSTDSMMGSNSSGSNLNQTAQNLRTLVNQSPKSKACIGTHGQFSPGVDKSVLHMRVNEVLRKTVMRRATNKGKIITSVGGSLDIDRLSGVAKSGFVDGAKSGNVMESKRELNQQRSLDGFEPSMRTMSNSSKTLGQRDLNKFRLATTTDAVTLRSTQASNSSISMGQSIGHNTANNMKQTAGQAALLHNLIHPREARFSGIPGRFGNRYSSSSSSTSSLLSHQDSFDDSSSHAIDLSSSSEASRNRQQLTSQQSKQSGHGMFYPSAAPADEVSVSECDQQLQKHYQKILQDSFNQLQLCQSQESMNKLLLQASQSSNTNSGQEPHKPSGRLLASGASQASKPDASLNEQRFRGQMFASSQSSQHFNISSSTQSLLAFREQHNKQQPPPAADGQLDNIDHLLAQYQQYHQQNNCLLASGQQQPQQPLSLADFNSWLLNYQSYLSNKQDSSSSAQGQAQDHAVRPKLLQDPQQMDSLYKSTLISQLTKQQQQQHQQQQTNRHNRYADPDARLQIDESQMFGRSGGHSSSRRNSMGRTLSSPVLVASNPVSSSALVKASDSSEQPASLMAPKAIATTTTTSTSTREDSVIDMLVDDPLHERRNEHCNNRPVLESNCSLDLSLASATNKPPLRPILLDKTTDSDEFSHSTSAGPQLQPTQDASNGLIFCSSRELELLKVNLDYEPTFDDNSSTGITFERNLCNHKCICGNDEIHPENSYRVLAIWRRLYERGLMRRCARVKTREATFDEIRLIHGSTYTSYFGLSLFERIKVGQLDLSQLPIPGLTQLDCGGQGVDIDTFWNEELTPGALRLAVGSVIESVLSVAQGKLLNAFAIVRPPGLHSESEQMMGFCFFNAVAIAAKILINECQLSRLLIVDWDVHHGNGIQKAFYDEQKVMYVSIHRYDEGTFFPGTGSMDELGSGAGFGFNWNVAWSDGSMGDAEYLAAFRSIVMPIARDYDPSMVLVACGFDAASRHPFNFGGYNVSPACFGQMTRQLMSLANGRIVLCLEGGFQLSAICDCAEACLRALLNDTKSMCKIDQIQESELTRKPNQSAVSTLNFLSNLAGRFWASVERWRASVEMSALEAANTRF